MIPPSERPENRERLLARALLELWQELRPQDCDEWLDEARVLAKSVLEGSATIPPSDPGVTGGPLKQSRHGHKWGKPYRDGYATCACGAVENDRNLTTCPDAIQPPSERPPHPNQGNGMPCRCAECESVRIRNVVGNYRRLVEDACNPAPSERPENVKKEEIMRVPTTRESIAPLTHASETESRTTCAHEKAYSGECVECSADRTVCQFCGVDVAPSGAGGGSWVALPHTHGVVTSEGWAIEMRVSRYRVVNGTTKRESHESTYVGSLTEEQAREAYRLANEQIKQIGSGTISTQRSELLNGQERSAIENPQSERVAHRTTETVEPKQHSLDCAALSCLQCAAGAPPHSHFVEPPACNCGVKAEEELAILREHVEQMLVFSGGQLFIEKRQAYERQMKRLDALIAAVRQEPRTTREEEKQAREIVQRFIDHTRRQVESNRYTGGSLGGPQPNTELADACDHLLTVRQSRQQETTDDQSRSDQPQQSISGPDLRGADRGDL